MNLAVTECPKCGYGVFRGRYRVSGVVEIRERGDGLDGAAPENTGMWDGVHLKRVGRLRCDDCDALIPKDQDRG